MPFPLPKGVSECGISSWLCWLCSASARSSLPVCSATASATAWLRARGWNKSVLMDALLVLDKLAGKVRCRLFATTRKTGTVQVDETVDRMDQIDDPQVRAELRKRGVAERSVLNLVK